MATGDADKRGAGAAREGTGEPEQQLEPQQPRGHNRADKPSDRTGDHAVVPEEGLRQRRRQQQGEQKAHRNRLDDDGAPEKTQVHASMLVPDRRSRLDLPPRRPCASEGSGG